MKDRKLHRIQKGFSVIQTRLEIKDDPSQPRSDDSNKKLIALLRELVDSPNLLVCGNVMPQSITISHDGECWVLNAVAEETNNLE
jgi:hypothetical protein